MPNLKGTIKQLKDFLANYPDNAKVLICDDGCGNLTLNVLDWKEKDKK